VSVQRSQASVERGHNAAYVVLVSTENNGSAADVSVALTAQPSSQKPTFTSGCAKENGTATCTVSSVSDKQPANLHAQIPVASSDASVTSVKLTAEASIVTSAKWTPPSATETVAVTAPAASASPTKSSASPAKSPTSAPPTTTLPLGPIPSLGGTPNLSGVPDLNGVSSSLIGPGNASGLFPAIAPSATPSPSPGTDTPSGKGNAQPVAESSAIGFGQPVLTAQVVGLIALAVAIMLTVTRLSLRRRFRSGKDDS
jgi:hypothetical protein